MTIRDNLDSEERAEADTGGGVVTVLFFGSLRDDHGDREVALAAAVGVSVGALWGSITGLSVEAARDRGIRGARNQTYCSWDEPVWGGDEVAFLPPVSGG